MDLLKERDDLIQMHKLNPLNPVQNRRKLDISLISLFKDFKEAKLQIFLGLMS